MPLAINLSAFLPNLPEFNGLQDTVAPMLPRTFRGDIVTALFK
jgi:hypothetical protein